MPYENFRTADLKSKERRWIIAGGVALAGIAGYVNVLVLGFFHVPVSHMTGAASKLGPAIFAGQISDVKVISSIIAGFFMGAVLSGMIIADTHLKPGRRYGSILMIEGALLGAATLFLEQGQTLGVPIAAMACGLQNAMASSYYGLVIRTTHMTGIVTDLGVISGHWLRGHKTARWKVVLLVGLLGGFSCGGFAGAFMLARNGLHTLMIAAAACVICGGVYWKFFRTIFPSTS